MRSRIDLKRPLSVLTDVAILSALVVVLLGDGPVGRSWKSWRDEVRTRRQIDARWAQLTNGRSRIDESNETDSQDGAVIVEFVDFECPVCSRAVDTLEVFKQRHPEVQIVIRQFPLTSIHPHAEIAARTAVCGDVQGMLRPVYLELFRNQMWREDRDMLSVARRAGLSHVQQFAECLLRSATTERVATESRLGEELGVRGTPAFVSRLGRHDGMVTVRDLEKLIGK